VPYSWDQWQWLVTECIRHYSGTASKAIDGIYYEVWNEPDLEGFGKWAYYGNKNYLQLYTSAARAAQKVRSEGKTKAFFIGGPSTTAPYQNWVKALVEHTQTNNLPLDFISWHRYSYDDRLFRQDLVDVRSWLGGRAGIQLVISEFGPDSEKSSVYNSSIAGAHAVAVARQLAETGLDWLHAFEIKDGPDQGVSGWGILSHNQYNLQTKPRYRAYAMMRNMTGNRLSVLGEGTATKAWAVSQGNEINLIVSNYDYISQKTEKIPARFENLTPGSYLLIWETLKGKGGEQLVQVNNETPIITQNYILDFGDVIKVRVRRV